MEDTKLWYVVATEKKTGKLLYGLKLPRLKVAFSSPGRSSKSLLNQMVPHYKPEQGTPLTYDKAIAIVDRKEPKVKKNSEHYWIVDVRVKDVG